MKQKFSVIILTATTSLKKRSKHLFSNYIEKYNKEH